MTLPAQQIDVWSKASHEDQIKALVLLAGMPAREAGDAHVDKAAYYLALDGVTRWGLSEAVKAILQGRLGHAFFPSPPELRMECDKAMEWHEQERQRVIRREQIERERREHAPKAEPSPEARARVAAAYAKFCAGHDNRKHDAEQADRAEVRTRYGMTPELIDRIADAELAKNWRKAG